MEEEKMRGVVGRPAGRAQEALAPLFLDQGQSNEAPSASAARQHQSQPDGSSQQNSRLRLGCSILWYRTREAPWAQKPGELS